MPPGLDDPIFVFFIFIFAPLFYAPLFLFGMGLAKLHAFENMQKEKKWYVIGAILVPVGLAFKAFSFIENNFSGMLLMGGSQLLAVGYVCLVALFFLIRDLYSCSHLLLKVSASYR